MFDTSTILSIFQTFFKAHIIIIYYNLPISWQETLKKSVKRPSASGTVAL